VPSARGAKQPSGEQCSIRGQRVENPVDVLFDVVEVERDPKVQVAGRGDDPLGR
jgi:hypothetical protein